MPGRHQAHTVFGPCGTDSQSAVSTIVSRPARTAQHPVRLACGETFQRLQETTGSNPRQYQDVNVVGHHHKGTQLIVAQGNPLMQTIHDHTCKFRLVKKQRSVASLIQIPVHPHESLSGRNFAGRRIAAVGKTPVQMPGHKEPLARRVSMRQAAA